MVSLHGICALVFVEKTYTCQLYKGEIADPCWALTVIMTSNIAWMGKGIIEDKMKTIPES
jgi:hypothetical protein